MLRWTTALYVVGLVAALLGFGGLIVVPFGIARILIVIFLAAFLASLIALAVGVARFEQGNTERAGQGLGAPLSTGSPSTTE